MAFLGLQSSFTAGELAPSLSVRVDLAKYQTGCKKLENMFVFPHGGAGKRGGFRFLAKLSGDARLMPFVFSVTDTYLLVWTNYKLYFYSKNGAILNAQNKAYFIESPYSLEDAKELSFVQSADVIYLASANHAPHKLSRYGHTNWKLEMIDFLPKASRPTGLTGSLHDVRTEGEINGDGSGKRHWYFVVTQIDSRGEESLPSNSFGVQGPENLRTTCYPKLIWNNVVGATEYRIYQEKNGKYGYIGSSLTTSFDAKNIAPDMTDCPPENINPFANGNFPSAICFYQQRLVFAGSEQRPQTIWFSRTGNYESFSKSSPAKADDAMEITIAGNEVSKIMWLVSLRTLLVGTSGTEWEVKSSSGILSPGDISMVPQSYRGSAKLPALIVGNSVLHLGRTNRELRDLLYDFGTDSYTGSDHAILAGHLFESHSIIDWTYQQSPYSIIWCVRSDGVLLGHTYLREHQVYAWHRHLTLGKFLAICTLPSTFQDELFAVIERTVNNEKVYYLEIMENNYAISSNLDEDNHLFYADSGLFYQGEATDTILGLEHLLNEEVCIVADGAVVKNQIVRDFSSEEDFEPVGSSSIGVKLPFEAKKIVVGLPYTARLQSMPLETELSGVSVGRKKIINRIGVYFKDTNSAFIGTDFTESEMDEVKWRLLEKPGQAVSLHSEDAWIYTNNVYDNQVYACVESQKPLPCTVLAIIPEFSVS